MEIWKDVVGYEGFYEVSSLGNVRSLDRLLTRIDGVQHTVYGRMMSLNTNDDGYLTVKLTKGNSRKSYGVHRLVAMAFLENINNFKDVNHINFNRKDNRVENLEWCDHGDNVRYSIKNGRHFCNRNLFGENNPNYKNNTLKDYYTSHPEEKKKLSRAGKQNGMCKKTICILPNGESKTFSYIRECAKYLVDIGISKSNNINALADRITKAVKNNMPYLNCQFQYE